MKKLHSILFDISLFVCVALPVIWCICSMFLIYAWDNDRLLLAYYAIKAMAIMMAIGSLCVVTTLGLGLYLSKRR